MENNQPNHDDSDKELEEIRKKIPGLEDDVPEESAADIKAKEEAVAAKSLADADAKAAADKKAIEDANIAKGLNPDGSAKAPPADDDQGNKRPSRPEKYIPIAQYVEEKKGWQKDKERVVELEAIVNGKKGSEKTEVAVKEYAEKYGVSEDSIKDLVSTIKAEFASDQKSVATEDKASRLTPEEQQIIDDANQIKAANLFSKEFTDLALPELKKAHPEATPEQLSAAKAEIERLSCTKAYLDKSLDYVVFKESSLLSKIFAPTRKGPEGRGTSPASGSVSLTASDFKEGKTPFVELSKLSSSEQEKIVNDMDIPTYDKYSRWIEQNDELVINRGGRKIK
jgi:hypothetical protein